MSVPVGWQKAFAFLNYLRERMKVAEDVPSYFHADTGASPDGALLCVKLLLRKEDVDMLERAVKSFADLALYQFQKSGTFDQFFSMTDFVVRTQDKESEVPVPEMSDLLDGSVAGFGTGNSFGMTEEQVQSVLEQSE